MCEYIERVNTLVCQIAEEGDAEKIQALRSEMHTVLLDALIVKSGLVMQSLSDNERILALVYTGVGT